MYDITLKEEILTVTTRNVDFFHCALLFNILTNLFLPAITGMSS